MTTAEAIERLQDHDAERAVIGAALASRDAAKTLAENLATYDFTSPGRAKVYHTLAELYLEGKEISAAIVLDTLGPETVADLKIDPEALEAWTMDSKAIEDPSLLTHLIKKLQRLRVARDYRKTLVRLLQDDPMDADAERFEQRERLLERARDSMASLSSLNGKPVATAIDIGRAADALEAEPIPWVLNNWLAEGDLVMLAGEGGAGKSWLLLDLAFALATCGNWLGAIDAARDIRPQRVLYLDQEQSARLVRYRINRWAGARDLVPGLIDGAPLRYLVENNLCLDDRSGLATVVSEIDDFRPNWIFMDSFVRFHGRNENDNSEMSQFFTQRLRPLAQRSGAGIVTLHHFGKGDGDARRRTRGAADLYNMVDVLWSLSTDDKSGSLILRLEKSRWGAPAYPLRVEISDVNNKRGVLIHSTGRADDAMGAILRELEHSGHDGMLRSEIVDVVKSEGLKWPGKAATRHLGELYDNGRVKSAKDGRATRYWLTQFSPLEAR